MDEDINPVGQEIDNITNVDNSASAEAVAPVAGPGAEQAAPVPASSPPSSVPQAQTYKSKEHIIIILLAIAVIVAIVAILTYRINLQQKPTNITSYSTVYPTTIVQNMTSTQEFSQIYSFLNKSNLITNTNLKFYGIYTSYVPYSLFIPQCFGPQIAKWYIYKNMQNISSPINESMAAYAPVFAEDIKVRMLNQSVLPNYSKNLKSMGYCDPFIGAIKSNSTFSMTQITVDNTTAYLEEFDNLNNNALTISSTPYTGAMPNVSWYYVDMLYRNISINVGAWGFTGHMNGAVSNITNIAGTVLTYVKSLK